MAIKLSDEIVKRLQASIKRYAAENLDEEIGDLKAGHFLEFCVKEIGPSIYNQAIADARPFSQSASPVWTPSATRTSSATGRRPGGRP